MLVRQFWKMGIPVKNKTAMTTIGALAMAAAPWAAVPAPAAIIYPINITSTTPEVGGELSPLSDTIIGSITTDGTLGVLQQSNILDWNFQLNDNYRPAFDVTLTPANSGIYVFTGTGLSASPTALSFDFSNAGSVFVIQGLLH
jgi:hypothetical protein